MISRCGIPLLFLAAVTACGGEPTPDTTRNVAGEGGTAIVAFNADMQSFNPLTNSDQNTTEVNYYMLFTPLIQYDADFEPRPYLATSWDLTAEQVTFRLNPDVRWHDGVPVTAHDVAFTFRRAKDPETASILSSAYLGPVESVEVLDSFTVRFRFRRPHSRPLDSFWWPPVPEHLLADLPADAMMQAAFNRAPVGSGPFQFEGWKAGESLTLVRNPDFPEALGGPPQLERVIIRFISEPSTLLSETLIGNIDVNGSLFPHQADRVRQASGVKLLAYPSREFYYIGWNLRNPVFSDPAVRRAMTLAIDRRQLIDVLLQGYGELASGVIPPWHPMYAEIQPLPYDPNRARALLDDAGWIDRDGDGAREDTTGRPLGFTLMTNHENPIRSDIAEIVQSWLGAIGVTVDVRLMEWQALLARHRGREFEAVVQSWVLDNFRVDPMALFHSSEADRPGSYNRSGLKSARVDASMERALTATAPETARELWATFAQELQELQPFTFLMWLDELAAVSDRMRNVSMDARGTLVTVADWRIGSSEGSYGR